MENINRRVRMDILLGLSWWQVLLLLCVAYIVYMSWHFRLFTSQGIPVPITRLPILGTALPLFRDGFQKHWNGYIQKHGKTTGIYMGRVPQLLTVDFDIIREVFIKQHVTFPTRTAFNTGDPMNDLMLANITDYDHWKVLRTIMSPTFSSGKLKKMMSQINTCAAVYAGHLVKQDDQAVNMKQIAGSYTIDVIASTAFGIDVNTAEDRNNPFVIYAGKAFEFETIHPVFLILIFFPFLKPLLYLFKLSLFNPETVKFFQDVTTKVLDERKDDESRVDFLQLMKNAHKEVEGDKSVRSMTKQEIISQGILFFLAGYDTTASTISFLAYNLALHPDKQDLLLEEIDRVVGDKDVIKDEELHEMPYLDMCVNESLRLYSPAQLTDRVATKDVVVKGIKLPKGSAVVVPIFQLHHMAELYPDPENFIPERFSSENKGSRDPLSFMPFGAGPRMCLATRLALIEVKVATIHILKTHRFLRAPETEVPLTFKNIGILQPKNGVWLRLEKRHK